jgi:predicted MFS family arabinose efflux permease
MPTRAAKPPAVAFTAYQKFVIAVLAFIQFTVVLDFMILSPLSAFLLPELKITTAQFGLVVSVYAFSASLSGILAAGFADRFDRKKFLLFFYGGFVLGTLFCGLAPNYHTLLAARMVTGLFGGVINGVAFAIIADLFPFEMRGRVMGVVMTAFAVSQVVGLPFGLFLANHMGWHMPFLVLVAVSTVVGFVIAAKLKPIDGHLKHPSGRNPIQHLFQTLTNRQYTWGFASTTLLATGGFMLMPFGAAFTVFNMGIPQDQLSWIYLATGLASIVAGPLAGKLSDSVGKFRLFVIGTLFGMIMVIWYCHLGITPLWGVIGVNVLLFMAINARMVSAQALGSAVPAAPDRGAYMAINGSLQQLSGGVASLAAGIIVVQSSEGHIARYDVLGFVVAGAMLITIFLMGKVNALVNAKSSR